MTYSKRNHRILKPNRAQRLRVASGQASIGSRSRYDNPLTPPAQKALEEKAHQERQSFRAQPQFKDQRGVAYCREDKGDRRTGFTIVRQGLRPVDAKRSQRAIRLGKTLNQHA